MLNPPELLISENRHTQLLSPPNPKACTLCTIEVYSEKTRYTQALSLVYFNNKLSVMLFFSVGVYFYTPATAIVQAAAMSPAATATPTIAGHQQEQGCQ
jgi:hypothetical protein